MGAQTPTSDVSGLIVLIGEGTPLGVDRDHPGGVEPTMGPGKPRIHNFDHTCWADLGHTASVDMMASTWPNIWPGLR